MHDVIPTIRGSDGSLLAASLACFAVAGVATAAAIDGLGLLLGATGLAVVGVYCVARYAQSVSRQTLAVTALALWVSFLGVAGAHAVGLESIGSVAPGPAEATVVALTAVGALVPGGSGGATDGDGAAGGDARL